MIFCEHFCRLAGVVMVMFDRDLMVSAVNGLFKSYFSQEPKTLWEFLPRHVVLPIADYCRENDSSKHVELLEKVPAAKKMGGAGGRYFRLLCLQTAVDGTYALVMFDSTERCEHEDFQRLLYRSFEQGSLATIIADLTGHIEFVSRRFVEITGYSEKEAQEQPFTFFCTEIAPRIPFVAWKTLGAVKDLDLSYRGTRKNGEEYFGRLIVAPVKDISGKVSHIVAHVDDVTEARKQEFLLHAERVTVERQKAQLEAQNKELTESIEKLHQAQAALVSSEKMASLGQLSAGVAHEINNPLGFVRSNVSTIEKFTKKYVELYARMSALVATHPDASVRADAEAFLEKGRFAKLGEMMPAVIGDVESGIDRIRRTVNDLKAYSRKDSEDELTTINDVIDAIVNITWNELKYKVELIRDYHSKLSIRVSSQRVGQIFINLLVNASQAIEKYGFIKIKTYDRGIFAVAEVVDTGCGMSPETMKKIFEPFFTTKPVGVGTGLGLSVSFSIAKSYGGDIAVESVPGKGSMFTVMIPLAKAEGGVDVTERFG
jgi:two-component system NtrC family sensor kinase